MAAEYFVYGGKAELGMQFVNVCSVDRNLELFYLLLMEVILVETKVDSWHAYCLEMIQGLEAKVGTFILFKLSLETQCSHNIYITKHPLRHTKERREQRRVTQICF